MASSLAKQLNRLKEAQVIEQRSLPKGTRASILFDYKIAATVDTDTIYTLAIGGFHNLVRECTRLQVDYEDLLTEKTKQLNREKLTQEENDQLHKLLVKFLYDLEIYFLRDDCHKVLEYLIRVYEIQQYEAEECICIYIGYHATSIYTKLLQNINLSLLTKWSFMDNQIKLGKFVTRELIINQCSITSSLLDQLCSVAIRKIERQQELQTEQNSNILLIIGVKPQMANSSKKNPVFIQFLSMVVLGILKKKQTISDNLSLVILRFIALVIKSQDIDAFLSGLLMLTQFLNSNKLTEQYIHAIINDIANRINLSNDNTTLFKDCLMFLIFIAQTQKTTIPPKALHLITNQQQLFINNIKELSNSYSVAPFIYLLMETFFQQGSDSTQQNGKSQTNTKEQSETLHEALKIAVNSDQALQKNESLRRTFLENILVLIFQSTLKSKDSKTHKIHKKYLKSLQHLFPSEIVDVLNEILHQLQNELSSEETNKLNKIIKETFSMSFLEDIPISQDGVQQQYQQNFVSLFNAMNSRIKAVKQSAVNTIISLIQQSTKDTPNEEELSDLRNYLMIILQKVRYNESNNILIMLIQPDLLLHVLFLVNLEDEFFETLKKFIIQNIKKPEYSKQLIVNIQNLMSNLAVKLAANQQSFMLEFSLNLINDEKFYDHFNIIKQNINKLYSDIVPNQAADDQDQQSIPIEQFSRIIFKKRERISNLVTLVLNSNLLNDTYSTLITILKFGYQNVHSSNKLNDNHLKNLLDILENFININKLSQQQDYTLLLDFYKQILPTLNEGQISQQIQLKIINECLCDSRNDSIEIIGIIIQNDKNINEIIKLLIDIVYITEYHNDQYNIKQLKTGLLLQEIIYCKVLKTNQILEDETVCNILSFVLNLLISNFKEIRSVGTLCLESISEYLKHQEKNEKIILKVGQRVINNNNGIMNIINKNIVLLEENEIQNTEYIIKIKHLNKILGNLLKKKLEVTHDQRVLQDYLEQLPGQHKHNIVVLLLLIQANNSVDINSLFKVLSILKLHGGIINNSNNNIQQIIELSQQLINKFTILLNSNTLQGYNNVQTLKYSLLAFIQFVKKNSVKNGEFKQILVSLSRDLFSKLQTRDLDLVLHEVFQGYLQAIQEQTSISKNEIIELIRYTYSEYKYVTRSDIISVLSAMSIGQVEFEGTIIDVLENLYNSEYFYQTEQNIQESQVNILIQQIEQARVICDICLLKQQNYISVIKYIPYIWEQVNQKFDLIKRHNQLIVILLPFLNISSIVYLNSLSNFLELKSIKISTKLNEESCKNLDDIDTLVNASGIYSFNALMGGKHNSSKIPKTLLTIKDINMQLFQLYKNNQDLLALTVYVQQLKILCRVSAYDIVYITRLIYEIIEGSLEQLEDSFNNKLVLIDVIRNVILGLRQYNSQQSLRIHPVLKIFVKHYSSLGYEQKRQRHQAKKLQQVFLQFLLENFGKENSYLVILVLSSKLIDNLKVLNNQSKRRDTMALFDDIVHNLFFTEDTNNNNMQEVLESLINYIKYIEYIYASHTQDNIINSTTSTTSITPQTKQLGGLNKELKILLGLTNNNIKHKIIKINLRILQKIIQTPTLNRMITNFIMTNQTPDILQEFTTKILDVFDRFYIFEGLALKTLAKKKKIMNQLKKVNFQPKRKLGQFCLEILRTINEQFKQLLPIENFIEVTLVSINQEKSHQLRCRLLEKLTDYIGNASLSKESFELLRQVLQSVFGDLETNQSEYIKQIQSVYLTYIQDIYLLCTVLITKKNYLVTDKYIQISSIYLQQHTNVYVRSSIIYCLAKYSAQNQTDLLQYLDIIIEKLLINLLLDYKELYSEQYSILKGNFVNITQYPLLVRDYIDSKNIFPSLIDIVEQEGIISGKTAKNILSLNIESASLFIENLKEMLSPIVIPLIICLVIFDREYTDKYNLMNKFATYLPSRVIIPSLAVSTPLIESLGTVSTINSSKILLKICSDIDSEAFEDNSDLLFKLILRGFDYSKTLYFNNQQYDSNLFQELENHFVDAFEKFSLKTSETTLRKYFQKFTLWSQKNMQILENNGQYKYFTKICYFRTANRLCNSLGTYFVSFYSFFFEFTVDFFNEITQQYQQSRKKDIKKRKQIETDSHGELTQILLNLILQSLKTCFMHDKDGFMDNMKLEKFNEPFVELLEAVNIPCANFISFVRQEYIPCLLALIDSLNDEYKWKTINYLILTKTRSEKPETRIAAITIISELIEHLKERYQVLINDILPFISETLEDENIEVEKISKNIVIRLEQVTGENIKEYLRSFR